MHVVLLQWNERCEWFCSIFDFYRYTFVECDNEFKIEFIGATIEQNYQISP